MTTDRLGRDVWAVWVAEEGTQRTLGQPGEWLTIGRDPAAELSVSYGSVSRRHATVRLEPDGVWIRDEGSRYGTEVEGEALPAGVWRRLDPRAALRVGGVAARIVQEPWEGTPQDEGALEAACLFPPFLPPEEYEVIRPLGLGGHGSVWEVERRDPPGRVAVKILSEASEEVPTRRARFAREARLAQQTRSEHVVQLLEVVEHDEKVHLILEFVEGWSLGSRIPDEGLSVLGALRVGEQLACALEALEGAGVVHRDVKPHNVVVSAEGVVKLTDFGIARGGSQDAALTAPGTGLGSLAYAAPEQLRDARGVDRRTDLYGLGATLFHVVTGRPLFDEPWARGLNLEARIRRVCEEVAPGVRERRAACPVGLEEWIGRLLAKDPRERPQGAREVREGLRRLREAREARSGG